MKVMPRHLSERTIRALKKHDRQLAQTIEEEMFLFDNLRDLDMRNLGIVLRGVDAAQLALALKGADEAMTDLCLSTMSQRAGETIPHEMRSEVRRVGERCVRTSSCRCGRYRVKKQEKT